MSAIVHVPCKKSPLSKRMNYTQHKLNPKEARAVSIGVGFRCSDGIVLCADQQFTITQTGSKYHDKKILIEEGSGWSLAFVYAKLPGLLKEAKEKIMQSVRQWKHEEITGDNIKSMADDVLTGMGRQYEATNLQFLLAVSVWLQEQPELLKFDGRALHTADDFNCLALGQSSVIHLLSDHFYSKQMDIESGASFGAYLIKQAEQYIDACGGPIDVVTSDSLGSYNWLSEAEVNSRIQKMEQQESAFPLMFKPSSLPI